VALEILGAFELIEKILSSLLGQLSQYRKTPRQRVARELVELSDLLGEAREEFNRLALLISRCEIAQTKEGKTYHLFEAGKVLEQLGRTCSKFVGWGERHSRIEDAFRLLAPRTHELLARLNGVDRAHTPGALVYTQLEIAISENRQALQAVEHPDPSKLPTTEILSEARQQLEDLAAHCSRAQEDIRAFARKELTAEDFF
jgi:hypothetical protein